MAALSCLLVLVLVAIGITMHARSAKPTTRSHQAAVRIDPRLILQPHTVTQLKQIAGLQLELTAAPLIPGTNHFTLRIDNHGHPSTQAAVGATATMQGMIMRPLHFALVAATGDRYMGVGTLPMFGSWHIALEIRQRRGGLVVTTFPLSLDLPAGLYSSPQTKQ
jgi:hypothetical protein